MYEEQCGEDACWCWVFKGLTEFYVTTKIASATFQDSQVV